MNYKRDILKPAILISFVNIFSSIILAGRDIFIANVFGAGDSVDAFVSAFLVPNFLINILGGALISVFIPYFIRLQNEKGEEKSTQFFTNSLVSIGIASFLISILIFLLKPLLFHFIASGYSTDKMQLSEDLFLFLLVCVVFNSLSVFIKARINIDKKYLFTSLSPILSTLISIGFILIFNEKFGIYSLAYGISGGYLCEFLLLFFVAKKKSLLSAFGQFSFGIEQQKLFKGFLPIIGGSLLMNSTLIIDQSMASNLGESSVSSLYFGNKFISFSLGVLGTTIGTILLPNFSHFLEVKDYKSLKTTLRNSSLIILFGTTIITFFVFMFSEQIVRLVFEHGAFQASATLTVAKTQSYYSLQLPAYFLGLVGVRFLNAAHQHKTVFFISGLNVITNILGNIFLIPLFGVAGIALSTSIVYTLSTMMIFIAVYVIMRNKNYGEKIV